MGFACADLAALGSENFATGTAASSVGVVDRLELAVAGAAAVLDEDRDIELVVVGAAKSEAVVSVAEPAVAGAAPTVLKSCLKTGTDEVATDRVAYVSIPRPIVRNRLSQVRSCQRTLSALVCRTVVVYSYYLTIVRKPNADIVF